MDAGTPAASWAGALAPARGEGRRGVTRGGFAGYSGLTRFSEPVMPRLPSSVGHALAAAALAAACGSGTDDPSAIPDFSVTAERVADGIRVANAGSDPLAYIAVEHSAPVQIAIKWGPCDGCTLSPGGSVVIPLDAIRGYTAETTQAILYLWRIVPDGGEGDRFEELKPVIVDL